MYSTLDSKITGFEFHPEFEKVRRKETIKSLKVDFLEKGRLITTESFNEINEDQIERLQKQLLDLIIINLNLAENLMEAKKRSMRTKVIGVVNMFRIETLRENGDKTKDIRIGFISSGYRVANTILKNVSENSLEYIEELLADNMSFNLRADRLCNAVTYLDLLAVINQKLNKWVQNRSMKFFHWPYFFIAIKI